MTCNNELSISIEAFKRHSKRLQKEIKKNNPLFKLTDAQNLLAKSFGLNNWHELNETFEQNKLSHEKEKRIKQEFLKNCESGGSIDLEDILKENFNFDIENGLKIAAKNGKFSIMNFIIEKYLTTKNIKISEDTKRQCFFNACKKGYISIVYYLIEIKWIAPQFNLNNYNSWGFLYACEEGHLELVKFFLEQSSLKENFNTQSVINRGFLKACLGENLEGVSGKEHFEIIKYLLSSSTLPINADIHTEEDKALIWSSLTKEIIQYLLTSPELNEHANIYARSGNIFEHLCNEARNLQYFEVIEYLINDYKIEKTPEIMQSLIKYNFI